MEYSSVKIPKVLSEKIQKEAYPLGYRSVSEFVMEATRNHLRNINRLE